MKILLFCQENLKFVQAAIILLPILLVLIIFSCVFCVSSSKEENNKGNHVEKTKFGIFKMLGNFGTSLVFFSIFFLSGIAASSKCLTLGTLI